MLAIDKCSIQNSIKTLEELKEAELPLYLWGAGNVAEEVYRLLEEQGITIAGVFVTTACGNKKKFGNYEVVTLDEVLQKTTKINVMIGHAQYHKKTEMEKNEGVNKVYYILNPFRSHDDIFYGDYLEHQKEYEHAFALFEEEYSQKVFQAYLNTRINDDLHYLLECFDKPITYYENGIFDLSKAENYVDIGAYNGDTVMDFVRSTNGKYNYIYAFEPEPELFNELQDNVNKNHYKNISLYQLGLWDSNAQLSFVSESGQSDRVVAEAESVNKIDVVTLDSILDGKEITFIKSNMSAGTKEWIEGAKQILGGQKPKLVINVGLTKQLLYQIPLLLHEINDKYQFALRFNESMPSRLFLYAY